MGSEVTDQHTGTDAVLYRQATSALARAEIAFLLIKAIQIKVSGIRPFNS